MLALLFATAASLPLQAAPGQDPGAAVRDLLSAKCVGCHNPDSDSKKARREFDGMQDFERILDEVVLAGDLALSDLWLAVEEGEMPPEDSDIDPLTEAELELIRGWIVDGAPLPEDGGTSIPFPGPVTSGAETPADTEPPADDEPQADAEPPPFVERLEVFGARLHPASTHLPIGLLLAAVFARILGWRGTRPRLRAAEGFCLLLGALGAAAASGLGWLAGGQGSHDQDPLFWHRWIAIGTASTALLLVLVRPLLASTRTYGWMLLLTGAAVCVAGYFGGELAWGDDGPRLGILFPDDD